MLQCRSPTQRTAAWGRHRSGGYLEPGVCDFGDEFASEARVDAKSALDPLPRLGDDILVEPLACRVIQGPDRDDSLMVGYLEVAHVRVSIEAECLDASIPAGAWPVGVQVKSVDRIVWCAERTRPNERVVALGRCRGACDEFLGISYKNSL